MRGGRSARWAANSSAVCVRVSTFTGALAIRIFRRMVKVGYEIVDVRRYGCSVRFRT